MRKILIIVALMLSFSSYAQSLKSSKFGSFNIGVVMPENIEGLNDGQLSKIETKISRVLESSGVTAIGEYCNFVVYPKFEVYESKSVEGGMQNTIITSVNLSLFIKQVDNNLLFSSITKTLKGSGTSQSLSLTNAISNIDVDDQTLKKFVETGKNKILQYYNEKCSSILAKADGLAKRNEFSQSIAISSSIPEGTSCYVLAQAKSLQYYKLYQNELCKKSLQEANISLTKNDYNAALDFLSEIDPASTCAGEAKAVIKNVVLKISAAERRDYEVRMKVYNDKVALQKQRINAIRDIAVAYYKNTATINYSYIVR